MGKCLTFFYSSLTSKVCRHIFELNSKAKPRASLEGGVMIKRTMLLMVMFLGLSGCAAINEFYYSSSPGLLPLPGGGDVQLFYSNPNYDPNSKDTVPLLFGKNAGEPTVTGGIGAMGIWRF